MEVRMLYVIGLYRNPPRGGEDPAPAQFVWFRLTAGLRTKQSADMHLALWRELPTIEVDGTLFYAVYRMVVDGSRLSWYGLSRDIWAAPRLLGHPGEAE